MSPTSMGKYYGDDFYHSLSSDAHRAAQVILPLVFNIIKPLSIIDVGCGTGAWLKVAQSLGVSQVLGVDGSHVAPPLREIDPSMFVEADLSQDDLSFPGRFDMALSLEVAEHLPIERAGGFVSDLCRASDVVLFSAAVPGQGGSHHVNEQWLSTWNLKFKENDYVAFDVIRPVVWTNSEIRVWYKQNVMLFINAQRNDLVSSAARATEATMPIIDLIHPELWRTRASAYPGLREAFKMTNEAIRRKSSTIFTIRRRR